MSAGDRLPALLLAAVVVSAGLLLAAVLTPEPPGGVVRPHGEHATMLVAARPGEPASLALGWALGAAQAALFVGGFALALRPTDRRGRLGRACGVGLALYEAGWAVLFWLHRGFAAEPGAPLVGSLPAPTAWMLYVLWPLPSFFAWLYWRHFDAAFLSERDIERFRARLAELREG